MTSLKTCIWYTGNSCIYVFLKYGGNKLITTENIRYIAVKEPEIGLPQVQPDLPDDVYERRLSLLLEKMEESMLDYLVVYADREHYGNFDFLTGYGPRFEEALLVLDRNGKSHQLLGNECLGMYRQSRIPTEGILYQALSLPNQPLGDNRTLHEILDSIGMESGHKIGVAGWKLLYPDF